MPVRLEIVGCIVEGYADNSIELPYEQVEMITKVLDTCFYINEEYTS